VGTFTIVTSQIVQHTELGIMGVFKGFVVSIFIFQSAEEALSRGIIPALPLSLWLARIPMTDRCCPYSLLVY